MPDTSLLQTILAVEEERRKQPSGGQKVIASLQQMMDGVAKGIQLYDNVRTMKEKYGSTQVTPPTRATASAPAIEGRPAQAAEAPISVTPGNLPVIPGSELRTSTAFTPGAAPTFVPGTPNIPAGGSDLSSIFSQIAAPVPSLPEIQAQAAIPGSVASPGTSIKNTDLARIMEIAGTFPDLARQIAAGKGIDAGLTAKETLGQLYQPVVDEKGNVTYQFIGTGKAAKPIDQQAKAQKATEIQIKQDQLELNRQKEEREQKELAIKQEQFGETLKVEREKLAALTDAKQAAVIQDLIDPMEKALVNPKIKKDASFFALMNDIIQETSKNGKVPELKVEAAKKIFGITFGKPKVSVKKGGAGATVVITKGTQKRLIPDTPEQRRKAEEQGWTLP